MRKFIINVNGNSYEVEVEEVKGNVASNPAPVAKPAAAPAQAPTQVAMPTPTAAPANKDVAVSAGQELIEAPMPGSILRVLVNEGDIIKAGDVLLILEAMKMENEILSPKDAKVAKIVVSAGASVNSGDQLIILE